MEVKKIWGFLVFTLFVLLPSNVLADTSYIKYTDIECNGRDVFGYSSYIDDENELFVSYPMNSTKGSEYSFVLTGYNLAEDDVYTYTLTSDYKNFKKEYTGRELMNGVLISGKDGDSQIDSILTSSDGKIIRNAYRQISSDGIYEYADNTRFYFNDSFNSTEMDAYFNSMVKNGKVKVRTIDPIKYSLFVESALSVALNMDYYNSKYRVYGTCDEEDKCVININEIEKGRYKEYDAVFEYAVANDLVKRKIDNFAKTFAVNHDDATKELFVMEDLETINYRYASSNYDTFIDHFNASINYSTEFQKKLNNTNFVAKLDARAGWDDKFTSGGYGLLNFLYNGIVYSYVELAGVKQNNVLYVPSDTDDTREDYIKAALDRINAYVPNADIKIDYAGQISDIDEDEFSVISLEDIVDVSKTLGEYYKVTIGDNVYYYFIAKDSSKMRSPVMNTVDVITDIGIETSSSTVPLDSKINSVIIDSNSSEYKEFLKRVNISNGIVVDLSLFSESINNNISKIDDGIFKVYVPLTSELKKLDLSSYYIKDNGEIEKHDVTIEGDYLVFTTDHFSTYVIGGDMISNPKTSDINLALILSMIALGSAGAVISYKKKNAKVNG